MHMSEELGLWIPQKLNHELSPYIALLPLDVGFFVVVRLRMPRVGRWLLSSHSISADREDLIISSDFLVGKYDGCMLQSGRRTVGALPIFGWEKVNSRYYHGQHPEYEHSGVAVLCGESTDGDTMCVSAGLLLHSEVSNFSVDQIPKCDARQVPVSSKVLPGAVDVVIDGKKSRIDFGISEGSFTD